jgi:hypothetical protein
MTSRQRLSIGIMIFALSVRSVGASPITVTMDPGSEGTSFEYQEIFFGDLAGTHFDGQTISLEILFSGFLVAPQISLNLYLNQEGGLGTYPNLGLSVSGYLLDEAGLQYGPEKVLPRSVSMPGQLNPHWPFSLPDGRPYFPPTTAYSLESEGARQARLDANLGTVIDIEPLVFSGVHYDIMFPDAANLLVGSRFTISNFSSPLPILVSPDPIPDQLSVTVPDSSDTRLLLLCGLLAMIVMRAKAVARSTSGA